MNDDDLSGGSGQGEQRTSRAVLDDHLALSRGGSVEDDLARNFAPDVAVLTRWGIFRGHDGMRELARRLERELPHARFEYRTVLVEGELAFLSWSGRGSNGACVQDGADSYLIRGGKILAQTIHYTVIPPESSQSS